MEAVSKAKKGQLTKAEKAQLEREFGVHATLDGFRWGLITYFIILPLIVVLLVWLKSVISTLPSIDLALLGYLFNMLAVAIAHAVGCSEREKQLAGYYRRLFLDLHPNLHPDYDPMD